MNWKATVVLAVVLCILIGVHIGLKQHRQQVKEAEEEAQKVYQIAQDDVTELRLAVRDEEEIVAAKKDDEWMIAAPVEARADGTAVERIVRDFAEAKRQRTVDEAPAEFGPYGLDEPELTIGVRLAEDTETEHVLLIGDQNPTKSYYFAKRADEDAVFLVNTWLKTGFDKTLKDLRDKKIIDAEKSDITMLDVVRADTAITLEKDDDTWYIRKPVEARADDDAMDTLLDKIASAEVQEFVIEQPGDLAEYGLDDPQVRLTAYTGDERAGQTLLIGSKNEDETGVYAKRDIAENIVLMKQEFLDEIPETVNDVRNRKLILATAHDLDKFEYSTSKGSFTFELDDEGTWYIEKPRRVKADTLALNDLFREFDDIEVAEFLAETKPEYGFDTPRARLAMWYKPAGETPSAEVEKKAAAEPVTVVIGAENPDDTELAYALNEEAVPVAVKFGKDELDALEKTFFDFRDKVLVSFSKDETQRMDVAYLDDKVSVALTNDKWSVVEPTDVKLRDQGIVDRLTWAIDYLKMAKIIGTETPEDTGQYGLDEPMASFTVHLKDGETIGPFRIGDESTTDADKFYATHAQKPGLYLVEKQVLDDIRGRVGDILGKTLKEVTPATRDRTTERSAETQKAAVQPESAEHEPTTSPEPE